MMYNKILDDCLAIIEGYSHIRGGLSELYYSAPTNMCNFNCLQNVCYTVYQIIKLQNPTMCSLLCRAMVGRWFGLGGNNNDAHKYPYSENI